MTDTDSAITQQAVRPIERIAVVSVHGCPDAQPGTRDAGGMNVYIRKVAQELSDRGVFVDVFSRNHDAEVPTTVQLAERARVVHVDAGDPSDEKAELSRHLPDFVLAVLDYTREHSLTYDVVHSHYWLSGLATTLLARRWGIPHVTTFHTLAEIKKRARAGEDEPEERSVGEERVIRTADAIVAFSRHESNAMVRFYDAGPDKIEVIPCGVDVDLFRPVDRREARQKLGIGEDGVVLFVGRLEPLKGVDILLRAVAQLERADTTKTVIVGGDQADAEMARLRALCSDLGIAERRELPGPYGSAGASTLLQRGGRIRHPVLLRELWPCGPGVDGVRHSGDSLARWRTTHNRQGRAERLSRSVALPGALRRWTGRAARQRCHPPGDERCVPADGLVDELGNSGGQPPEHLPGSVADGSAPTPLMTHRRQ